MDEFKKPDGRIAASLPPILHPSFPIPMSHLRRAAPCGMWSGDVDLDDGDKGLSLGMRIASFLGVLVPVLALGAGRGGGGKAERAAVHGDHRVRASPRAVARGRAAIGRRAVSRRARSLANLRERACAGATGCPGRDRAARRTIPAGRRRRCRCPERTPSRIGHRTAPRAGRGGRR